jgi:hypothetical protein
MSAAFRHQRAAEAFIKASWSKLYVVVFEDERDLFYTESPEEQGLTADDPQEYLVRVFTSHVDAVRYMENVRDMYQQMHFAVREFKTFETLWPVLMDTHQTFLRTLCLPVRACLSAMPPQEWPKDLGEVFSVNQMQN